MARILKVSEARRLLFDLVDDVIDRADEVILIEHRDRTERAALVNEDYIVYLQATIEALRGEGSAEFSLAGSMRLAVGEDELESAIAEVRKDQTARSDRKLDGV
jgi:hypothetical protein